MNVKIQSKTQMNYYITKKKQEKIECRLSCNPLQEQEKKEKRKERA